MSIRSETRRRLLILLAVVTLAGGCLGGLFLYREHRRDKRALNARARGMEALDKGEYEEAMSQLAVYLDRFPEDAEPMRLLAGARLEVPDAGGRHLGLAMRILERSLAVDPGDEESLHTLLGLYRELNRNVEARRTADEILGRDRNDPEARWTLAVVHQRGGEFSDAKVEVERFLTVSPDSLKGYLLLIGILKQLDRPTKEILDCVESARNVQPSPDGFDFVRAHAYVLTGQIEEARSLLQNLVDLDVEDEGTLRLLAQSLAQVGLSDEAMKVLSRVAGRSHYSPLHPVLARRDYELGNHQAVLDRIDEIEAAGRVLEPQLAGLRVLAMVALGRSADAAALTDRIQSKRQPDAAVAWRNFLRRCVLAPAEDVRGRIDAGLAATQKLPDTPWPHMFLARAYEDAQEISLALRSYDRAADLAESWVDPRVRSAVLLVRARQIGDAALSAEAIQRIDPENPDLFKIRTAVQAAVMPGMKLDDVEKLLSFLEKLNRPELEPLICAGMSRLGRDQEALTRMRAFAQRPPPPASELLQAAALCHRAEIPIVEELLSVYEKEYGVTVEMALFQSSLAAKTEGVPEALKQLESLRAMSAEPDAVAWRLVRLRILDGSRDEDVVSMWRDLADGNPDSLAVQNSLLVASVPWQDRELVDRAIKRVRAATGDTGLNWRYARARWLMAGEPERNDVSKAAEHLRVVVDNAPGHSRARILLASALERLGETDEAVQQLDLASAGMQNSTEIALQAVELRYRNLDLEGAEDRLEALVGASELTPEQMIRAARLFSLMGKFTKARAVIRRVFEDPDLEKERLLLSAALAAKLGNAEETERIIQDLLAEPEPRAVLFAVEFYASRSNKERAAEVLELLGQTDLKPEEIEVQRARLAARFGDDESALARYRSALALNSGALSTWIELASYLAQSGNLAELRQSLTSALGAAPTDANLKEIRSAIGDLEYATGIEQLRPLASDAIRSPVLRASALAGIRAHRKATEGGELAHEEIRKLADKNPQHYAMQLLAMQQLSSVGDFDRLLVIGRRTMRRFPMAAAPAKILAQALMLTGQWSEALVAATEWERRSSHSSLQAMMAVATINLRLNNPQKSLDVLDSLPNDAREFSSTLYYPLRWAALCELGSHETALRDFESRAKEDNKLIAPSLKAVLLAQTSDSIREMWLTSARQALAEEEIEARLFLANAWAERISSEHASENARETALELLHEIEKAEDLSANQLFSIGAIYEMIGDLAAAQAHYEACLKVNDEHVAALNNLAMVLLRAGRTEEAFDLARKVVGLYPKVAELRDTLAQVLRRRGEIGNAVEEYEKAIRLEPKNVRWPIVLADLLAGENRLDEAKRLRAKILDELKAGATVPAKYEDAWERVGTRTR